MVDEQPDRKPDYLAGTTGGSASSPTREEELAMRPIASGTIVSSIIALLIGWIPLVGPAVAGFAGGYVAGTRIRGLYATFVAGIISMFHYWMITYLPELPFAWAETLTGILAPMEAILFGASGIAFSLLLMGSFLIAIVFGWIGGLLQERRGGRDSMERTARPF